ncbi:DNA polymerase family B-domain-containing protein [Sporodiniella umbellata]|nr:DNA polymerase family B-domain-containing protein [Sporodiniella umbellata]
MSSSSRAVRGNKLQQLREAMLNKKKSSSKNLDDLFEEVEENDYLAIQNDEAFVEDDDEGGYIDNGEAEEYTYSDEYETEDNIGNGKRKRKSKQKQKSAPEPVKSKQPINKYFSTSMTKKYAGERPTKKKPVDSKESDSFMDSLLLEFDAPARQMPRAPTSQPPEKKLHSSHLAKLSQRNTISRDYLFDQPVQADVSIEEAVPAPVSKPETDLTSIDFDDDMMNDVKIEEVEPSIISSKSTFAAQAPKDEKFELQGWEDANANMMDTFAQDEIKEEKLSVDVFENEDRLKMWWYDAYERKEKGYVYLFGKILNKSINKYVSCCVTVKNIERNLFFLPRKFALDESGNTTDIQVEATDVYDEVSKLFSKTRITKYASKKVSRKYAFELPDVPSESDYLKVLYSYEQPALTGNESGKTFSRVFGASTGPLEHFLIKRDIMGPCWLEVSNAQMSKTSETWCKVEITVDDPKKVNPLMDEYGNRPVHIPPLTIMSISLRTIMNSKKNANEIVAASALVCNGVQIDDTKSLDEQNKMRFAVVRQLEGKPYPAGFLEMTTNEKKKAGGFSIQTERTEASLLNFLIARIHLCDPDVIIGHNFAGFDLDVLLHRMKTLNVQHWHRLGRLKRKNWPKLQTGAGGMGESTFQERMIMSGRLVCDTYLASKDLIRSKSYSLTNLAQSQLKIVREDIEFSKSEQYFDASEKLFHFLKHCSFDSYLTTYLMFKLQILPLTHQLTTLAGNLWSRTMTGARAERNEFLLLHEFHKAKYICPDKSFGLKSGNTASQAIVQAAEQDDDEDAVKEASNVKKSGRRKPAYAGGLVLEPKKGFYDRYVLLLDFNSLYPSIIQEYNVCFTTVDRSAYHEGAEKNEEEKVPDIPGESSPEGILPKLLKTLVDRRRQVKNAMKGEKSEAKYTQLNIRQQALKLTANSMYGCLGFTYSRFYAKPLAMLITFKGREILQSTVNLAGGLDMNVIYGDTDSIMVYTNQEDIQEVKKMGNLLRKKVNEHYKLLEIGIDGYFKHMLLLKKKKYAALLVEEKDNGELVESVETKGLDLVRRDWCDLSHDVSSHVLNLILSDRERDDVVNEIHTYLEVIGERIRQGEIPLDKFVINKQLTKRPQDYADSKSQPHVQVALRMLLEGQNVKSGDTVPYVICNVDEETSGDKKGSALRAYHPDDVVKKNMQLDIEWYLHQQVHPPLTRLCSPIEGTDPARLAGCLGLETSRYRHITMGSEDNDQELYTLDSKISDAERFKSSDPVSLICSRCDQEFAYSGILRQSDATVECGLECTQCRQILNPASLKTQLLSNIRRYINTYYKGWLVCDDSTCRNRTRMLSVFGRRCLAEDCRGTMTREYTDKQLYTQLLFFYSLFDPEKARNNIAANQLTSQHEAIINNNFKLLITHQSIVGDYLERSGYRYVDLSKLMII